MLAGPLWRSCLDLIDPLFVVLDGLVVDKCSLHLAAVINASIGCHPDVIAFSLGDGLAWQSHHVVSIDDGVRVGLDIVTPDLCHQFLTKVDSRLDLTLHFEPVLPRDLGLLEFVHRARDGIVAAVRNA